jgi:hypothetical protein
MNSLFRPCALVAIFAQLGLVACINTERETATFRTDPRREYTPPTGRGQRVSSATILNTVRATHPFSNAQTPDVFLLQMRGPRILSSQLHFIILTNQGDTLRHEVLPARVLLDDPTLRDNVSASVRDKEINVLRGMNNFFSASHFIQPATTGTTPPAALDAQAWKSLRNDPSAVGFEYPSASGAPTRLAYSRQLSRVVILSE